MKSQGEHCFIPISPQDFQRQADKGDLRRASVPESLEYPDGAIKQCSSEAAARAWESLEETAGLPFPLVAIVYLGFCVSADYYTTENMTHIDILPNSRRPEKAFRIALGAACAPVYVAGILIRCHRRKARGRAQLRELGGN